MNANQLVLSAMLMLGALAPACARNAGTRAESAEKQAKLDTRPLIERARALASMGDMTRAEQYLNIALENGADEREVFPLLLSVCISDGRYRSATSYSENYLRKHPGNHHVRFVLATLYSGLGDTENATKQFKVLLAANPEHAEAHYAYAVLLRDELGDYSGADEHFREYLRVQPSGRHSEEAHGSLLKRVP